MNLALRFVIISDIVVGVVSTHDVDGNSLDLISRGLLNGTE